MPSFCDASHAEPLSGDGFRLEFYDDGYPKLPECLRRRARFMGDEEIQNLDVHRTVQSQKKDCAGNAVFSSPSIRYGATAATLRRITITLVALTVKAARNTFSL